MCRVLKVGLISAYCSIRIVVCKIYSHYLIAGMFAFTNKKLIILINQKKI